MKIVQILGGLGNQMFQYALAIVLKEKFNETVFLDTYFMNRYKRHNGYELSRIFNIEFPVAKKSDIQRLYYKPIDSYFCNKIYRHLLPVKRNELRELKAGEFRNDVMNKTGDTYYDGYWQDYRYFINYKKIICQYMSFKDKLDKNNEELFKKLLSFNSISIHVRRGDYSKNKDFGGLCNLDYYTKAIKKAIDISENKIIFLLLSDDIQWVKDNIIPLINKYEYIICDWNNKKDSYKDMYLMTGCKTNILANSSFSWWGAFLNIRKDQDVIAPLKWSRNNKGCQRQFPQWLLIPNK